MREFAEGVRLLGRGWGYWKRRPSTMALGLLPAALVGLVLLGALIVLAVNLGAIGRGLTPFADDWDPFWRGTAELAAQALVLGGAVVLAIVTFTALTLMVGEPFYDRVWRAVERDETGTVPPGGTGFCRAAQDGLALFARGLLVAVVTALCGLLPVVGTLTGWVLGVGLTGWILAHELSSRALTARGIHRPQRNRVLRANRPLALGFGVATQLCFLVPGGAVVTMPAAVAGSTLLAQRLVAGAAPVGQGAGRRPAPGTP